MYESPSRNWGPSHTFGNKTTPIRPKDTPGPGNYECNTNAVKDKTVSYSMGKQGGRRSAHSKSFSDAPGPGNYDSPTKFGSGQGFKIGERREQVNRDHSPGPGAY